MVNSVGNGKNIWVAASDGDLERVKVGAGPERDQLEVGQWRGSETSGRLSSVCRVMELGETMYVGFEGKQSRGSQEKISWPGDR